MTANVFTKEIFGKNMRFFVYQPKIAEILMSELSIYPDTEEPYDLKIHIFISSFRLPLVNKNTTVIHLNSKLSNIKFYANGVDIVEIAFEIKEPLNKIHSFIQRMLSLGYNDRLERVGLILHEQVLIPYAIFFSGFCPIHGSAMSINNKTVIFGGKGGVGKTTLELEFCLDHQALFLSDDMVILDSKNYIYPNLNFPKIYAYNTIDRDSLGKFIKSSASLGDKIHWNIRSFYNLSKVRRRVNPKELYGDVETQGKKIDHYYMLNRGESDEIQLKKMSLKDVLLKTTTILSEEFDNLFYALVDNGLVNRKIITKKWETTLTKILKDVDCYEIKIPKMMNHQDFRKLVPYYLEEHISTHL